MVGRPCQETLSWGGCLNTVNQVDVAGEGETKVPSCICEGKFFSANRKSIFDVQKMYNPKQPPGMYPPVN